MPSYLDNYIYCSPLSPVDSLDAAPPTLIDGPAVSWTEIPDPGADSEHRYHQQYLAERVSTFVVSLSAREQEVVRRVFWNDERQSDVAKALGVSRMAISKMIKKVERLGRKRLPNFNSFSLH